MATLHIKNGTVIDPANGVDQQIQDLWINDGRIVDPPGDLNADRVIDAGGKVVMPGGIDVHCHIAGAKVNAARKLMPERIRSSADDPQAILMTTEQTGLRYAGLGYTTAFDAAVPAALARQAHMEFEDTPCIDKGMFVLAGNNNLLLEWIRQGADEQVKNALAWLIGKTGAYAPKLVNPGGIEKWKRDNVNVVGGIDTVIDNDRLTPRAIIQTIAKASNELGLPHPVHIHCNDLGRAGNWRTTLDTMQSLDGLKAHLTHIQFHSYGGGDDDDASFGSQVAPLADYLNAHDNLTVDVGQIMFGKTVSLTGDGALGEYLYRLNGNKWVCHDLELEAGCGISPLVYRQRDAVAALQWMVGLEWFLRIENPWKICLSTDHPNGGSFLAYPQIIALLMSADKRKEVLAKLNSRMLKQSQLPEMDRQYSLFEIAVITRAAPARMLGLKSKGHLGAGADADITIYEPQDDIEQMFQLPEYVIKSGQVMVEGFAARLRPDTRVISTRPEYDQKIEESIAKAMS